MHLYYYNTDTHTLHIHSGCPNASRKDYTGFDSEDEAVQKAGRALGMCIHCMKKRDEILKKMLLNKED